MSPLPYHRAKLFFMDFRPRASSSRRRQTSPSPQELPFFHPRFSWEHDAEGLYTVQNHIPASHNVQPAKRVSFSTTRQDRGVIIERSVEMTSSDGHYEGDGTCDVEIEHEREVEGTWKQKLMTRIGTVKRKISGSDGGDAKRTLKKRWSAPSGKMN
ncbi:hypothetical protein K470DRAFT_270749 [Piedraia hortae CBS 480.64]|uniref:Uncharacterized protein n=1 Tax=Piedraia hortae CBS 480.64 TaxID=1314780 RepID=A0A6A7BZ47_9PEZI|nr:hypothetical protein K470DRAFT_270749 [Piedraia hortae CBS 480.64]